jgi:hypothetical protein
MKPNTIQNVAKLVPKKVVPFLVQKVRYGSYLGTNLENIKEDVLLDGGSRINIFIKQLKLSLGLPKTKRAPYNLNMAD